MVSTEVKLWFFSSLEHFWPDPWDTLSEVALFFEKMHKVFKNKAQGCSTPLICFNITLEVYNTDNYVENLLQFECSVGMKIERWQLPLFVWWLVFNTQEFAIQST